MLPRPWFIIGNDVCPSEGMCSHNYVEHVYLANDSTVCRAIAVSQLNQNGWYIAYVYVHCLRDAGGTSSTPLLRCGRRPTPSTTLSRQSSGRKMSTVSIKASIGVADSSYPCFPPIWAGRFLHLEDGMSSGVALPSSWAELPIGETGQSFTYFSGLFGERLASIVHFFFLVRFWCPTVSLNESSLTVEPNFVTQGFKVYEQVTSFLPCLKTGLALGLLQQCKDDNNVPAGCCHVSAGARNCRNRHIIVKITQVLLVLAAQCPDYGFY